MQKQIESRNLEVVEMTDDVLICREIVTTKITIDQHELASKQAELEAAKFAKEEAERKINSLHAEMEETEQLVSSVREKLAMQQEMDEMAND